MFCPSCLFPNPPNTGRCVSCQADLASTRERISIGAQFLFADASERRPVALSLDGSEPQRLTRPTVISRHVRAVALGDEWLQPGKYQKESYKPNVNLPHLPVEKEALTEDTVAVRPGQGRLHVTVHDMYDANKVGTIPGIDIQVKG